MKPLPATTQLGLWEEERTDDRASAGLEPPRRQRLVGEGSQSTLTGGGQAFRRQAADKGAGHSGSFPVHGDTTDEVAHSTSPPQHERPVCSLPLFRHPQAEREIRLGKAVVAYEVKRARRRTIGMVVGVEGLSVRAPRWVSWADIESALRAKERWICAKLVEQHERAQRQLSARIDWREGATVPYLGELVVVVLDPRIAGAMLHEAPMNPALPSVAQRALHLGLPHHATAEQMRDAAEAWLQREARRVFTERVPHFASQLEVMVTKVSLSSARTRWGSASADGSVRLHWRLIHFSTHVIDYVVAHELAHLREMNHSPRFWDVVRSVMPEFDGPREQLRHVTIPD